MYRNRQMKAIRGYKALHSEGRHWLPNNRPILCESIEEAGKRDLDRQSRLTRKLQQTGQLRPVKPQGWRPATVQRCMCGPSVQRATYLNRLAQQHGATPRE